MKAIIPVAGAGTRLRPLTYTQPKPLIPLAGKPIIGHVVDSLRESGIEEFVFIIGYLGDKIKQYIEQSYPEMKKAFVYQESREGLGHAIWTAREKLEKEEEILIVLGDLIFEADLDRMINAEYSCLATAKVADPRDFGVVEEDANGFVQKAIEKPRIPKSNHAIVGIYKIRELDILLSCLDELVKNDKRTWGEIQLTDALMCMIEKGVRITTMMVRNWFDCGKSDILLKTNALLLDKAGSRIPDKMKEINIIIPPVHIGENCQIKYSVIGPHVTVGNHARLNASIVRNSIIGEYSNLQDVSLKDSIVGNDTAVKGYCQQLNLGDNTQIDFSARGGN